MNDLFIFIWVIGMIFTTGFTFTHYRKEDHQIAIFVAIILWCILLWPYFLGRQVAKLGMPVK